MKKIHLICNSHIDPVWMWDYQEGLGAGVSTFYQAAEFCKEFDYVFCHNESVLYEFIEQTDPALFAEIQQLVSEGKWKIIGGWYVQPDCNMPCGESVVRQIKLGREYFQEKFNARPTTALNFDSCGHSVGMVQILKKCGYDSYLCCRPMPHFPAMSNLPSSHFNWIGLDGSQIKVTRTEDEALYTSAFGNSLAEVKRKINHCANDEVGAILWGVGNHGGNPSRKDIRDINNLRDTTKDLEIVHSYPEAYFAELHPTVTFDRSMQPCLIGVYASMNSIKRKNIELETTLFTTEKLCSMAELNGLYKKEQTVFTRAEKALAFLQFHDSMGGTITPDAEKSVLRRADCAIEMLQEEFDKAYFALANRYERAKDGEYPFFVFNPQAYTTDTVVEAEYLMLIPIDNDEQQYTVTAWQDGKKLPTQCIKELSNINYDRRKRIAFRCNLAPLNLSRINFTVEVEPKQKITPHFGDILFSDTYKSLRISEETGLLESYQVNGKELLRDGAFLPVMYDDTPDCWAWYLDKLGSNPTPFTLSDCKKGPFLGLKNVNIVEEGDVLTEVESFFEGGSSFVKISYKLYRDLPYTDVTVEVLWNEQNKALKLQLPYAVKGDFVGQIPFGKDNFSTDSVEHPAHRFVGIQEGEQTLSLYNDSVYDFSSDGNTLYALLLRGVAYTAHPIGARPLLKHHRFEPYIEQGKHVFRFRLSYDKTQELENNAAEFLSGHFVVNYFPHGEGNPIGDTLKISNKAIGLAAFYKENDGYILRLINNNETEQKTTLWIQGKETALTFDKFEVKTMFYKDGILLEKEIWV